MANFFILKGLEYDLKKILRRRGLEKQGEVQKYIDSKVLEYCEPYVPKRENFLIASGKEQTIVGSGEVRYRTLYARRWYYMPANFQEAPQRGNYWFERMKQRHKKQILEGAVGVAKRNTT